MGLYLAGGNARHPRCLVCRHELNLLHRMLGHDLCQPCHREFAVVRPEDRRPLVHQSAAPEPSATVAQRTAGEAPSRPAFPASYSPEAVVAPVSASSCAASGDLLEGAGS